MLALFMQTNDDGGPPYHCPIPDMKELFTADHWRWPDPPYLEAPHHGDLYEIGVVLKRHEVG